MLPYADAADTLPEPCSIAGTVMRPFCLGHHLLLKRLGLTFVDNPTADGTTEATITAIAICGDTYANTLQAVLNGEWADTIAEWQKDWRGPAWKRRRLLWPSIKREFRDYLKAGY